MSSLPVGVPHQREKPFGCWSRRPPTSRGWINVYTFVLMPPLPVGVLHQQEKRIWRCMKTNVKDFEHEHLFFVTSTVLNWINLFDRKRFAQVVIDSLKFITEEQWINVYAFVLMPNHIHLIIKFLLNHTADQVFRDFHKYTAQQILKIMRNEKSVLINKFIVNKKDRKHQVWQRDPEFKNVYSAQFLLQKAEYIHNNPLQPKMAIGGKPRRLFILKCHLLFKR